MSWTQSAFIKFLRATIETLPYGISDELLKTTPIKSIKLEKFEINLKKRPIPTHLASESASQVLFNVFLLCFVLFWYFQWFSCLSLFRICTDDTKYCKHGIDLLLFCDIGVFQLIIFQVEGFHEVRICSLQVVSCLYCMSFQDVFYSQKLFQVVSCPLSVVSPSHFLLV